MENTTRFVTKSCSRRRLALIYKVVKVGVSSWLSKSVKWRCHRRSVGPATTHLLRFQSETFTSSRLVFLATKRISSGHKKVSVSAGITSIMMSALKISTSACEWPKTSDEILRETVGPTWWSGPWVPPGEGQCPTSCGQRVLAVPGWWRRWCHWLTISVLWAVTVLIQVWEEIPQENHPLTHQERARMLSGVRTATPKTESLYELLW